MIKRTGKKGEGFECTELAIEYTVQGAAGAETKRRAIKTTKGYKGYFNGSPLRFHT
jgi:hypothetical protein